MSVNGRERECLDGFRMNAADMYTHTDAACVHFHLIGLATFLGGIRDSFSRAPTGWMDG